jgi:hypothetical protein
MRQRSSGSSARRSGRRQSRRSEPGLVYRARAAVDRGSHPARGAINGCRDLKWKTETSDVKTPIDSPFEVD